MKKKNNIEKKIWLLVMLIISVALFKSSVFGQIGGRLNPTFQSVRVDSVAGRTDTIWISNREGSIVYLITRNDSLIFGDVSGEKTLASLAIGGTPGGSPNDIQFNDAGNFGGAPMTTDETDIFIENVLTFTGTSVTIIDSNSIKVDSSLINILLFDNTRMEDTLLYMVKYLPNSNYYSWVDLFSSDYDISIRAVQADTSFAGLSIDNYGFQAKSYPNIYNPAQDWDIKELILGGEINDRYELKSNKYDNSVYSRIGIKPDYVFVSAGATASTDTTVKITSEGMIVDKITFNPTTQPNTEGSLFYDEYNFSLATYLDIPGFREILGRGVNIRFYNNTGSTLTKGTLITSAGAKVNGAVTFTARLAGNGSLDSLEGVAMVVVDVLDNNYGMARLVGQVDSLNTSMYVDNQLLWVGSGGTLIDTIPEAPNFSNLVARVVYADADSGAIFMFPISQIVYDPNPDISINFTRKSETINNPGQNISALITNATNDLYTVGRNIGYNVVGDTINPKQYGVYNIDFSHSFLGDAATDDDWRVGIFKNGVEVKTEIRTSSSSKKVGASSSVVLTLGPSDWISLRVINTTSATRDAVFIEGVVNITFTSLQ